MRRHAFTLLELLFVIVIMGLLAKFGMQFLAQAYNSFILSKINNTLQANSESAVEEIAARLQYRIKDSVIGRIPNTNTFDTPASIPPAQQDNFSILEWIGSDSDGFRGDTKPYWSGVIDLDPSKTLGNAILVSHQTFSGKLDTLIKNLSNNDANISDVALYFVGSNSNVQTGFGWDGNATTTQQNVAMHPVRAIQHDVNTTYFQAVRGDNGHNNSFAGVDVYEYYKLAWTAYAVGIDNYNNATHTGTLKLWYDFQPWKGEEYNSTTTKSVIIMKNVSTFRYKSVGSLLKIQVCTKSSVESMSEGNYSICKEKTVY